MNSNASARLIDEYLTVDRAAEQLDVHHATLLRYCREGRVRYHKIGTRYMFTLADLRAFLEASKVEPRRSPPRRTGTMLKHLKG